MAATHNIEAAKTSFNDGEHSLFELIQFIGELEKATEELKKTLLEKF